VDLLTSGKAVVEDGEDNEDDVEDGEGDEQMVEAVGQLLIKRQTSDIKFFCILL
jgi:hypothetical protein